MALPGLASAGGGLVVSVSLVETTGFLASRGETTAFAVLQTVELVSRSDSMSRCMARDRTLWTGLTIQLMRGSRRIALC